MHHCAVHADLIEQTWNTFSNKSCGSGGLHEEHGDNYGTVAVCLKQMFHSLHTYMQAAERSCELVPRPASTFKLGLLTSMLILLLANIVTEGHPHQHGSMPPRAWLWSIYTLMILSMKVKKSSCSYLQQRCPVQRLPWLLCHALASCPLLPCLGSWLSSPP